MYFNESNAFYTKYIELIFCFLLCAMNFEAMWVFEKIFGAITVLWFRKSPTLCNYPSMFHIFCYCGRRTLQISHKLLSAIWYHYVICVDWLSFTIDLSRKYLNTNIVEHIFEAVINLLGDKCCIAYKWWISRLELMRSQQFSFRSEKLDYTQ